MHTKAEVELMAEFMGYPGVPCWIFMGALTEWKLSSSVVLANAKEWAANGKPAKEIKGDS